jgi:hypothetical protein
MACDVSGVLRRPRDGICSSRGWARELDCFDFIEDLKIANGPLIDVLTATELARNAGDAWPLAGMSAANTVRCLLERWVVTACRVCAIRQRCCVPGRTPFRRHDRSGQPPVPAVEPFIRCSCHRLNMACKTSSKLQCLVAGKVWLRYRAGSLRQLAAYSQRYIAAHRSRTQALAEARLHVNRCRPLSVRSARTGMRTHDLYPAH